MASLKKAIRIDGLKELEDALQELPRATGGNVLKRAILQPAQAFADAAAAIAPVDSGFLKSEIRPGKPRIITAGKAAYAQAMQGGATRSEAAAAARAANSAAGGSGRRAVVSVGPTRKAFYGQFDEFGTAHQAPQPFMRPTWDRMQGSMLGSIATTLKTEIEKARQRIAKRAERRAAKLKAGG